LYLFFVGVLKVSDPDPDTNPDPVVRGADPDPGPHQNVMEHWIILILKVLISIDLAYRIFKNF
jgi:hypothetical protein